MAATPTKSHKLPKSLKVILWAVVIFASLVSCYWLYEEWVGRVKTRIARAEVEETRQVATAPVRQLTEDCVRITPDWQGIDVPTGYRVNVWPKGEVTFAVRVNRDDNRVTLVVPGVATQSIGDDITHIEWMDPNTTHAGDSPREIYWRLTKK